VTVVAFSSLAFHPADKRQGLFINYRSWTKATERPQDMSPSMALSCVGPRKWDTNGNPHWPKVFVVYVNKAGEKAMKQKGSTKFPDGTVIVKEKYPRPPIFGGKEPDLRPVDTQKLLKQKPELLTVMVKADGKWDYFAVGADGKVQDGDSSKCRSCHEYMKENDYAFRPYFEGAAAPTGPWR